MIAFSNLKYLKFNLGGGGRAACDFPDMGEANKTILSENKKIKLCCYGAKSFYAFL